MQFDDSYDVMIHDLDRLQQSASGPMERFRAEIDFARKFADLFPDEREKWQDLILEAVEQVARTMSEGPSANVENAVLGAEKTLEPIGKKAKEYTVHCCGHAHIDMNWMWPWQETVNVTHDTFSTVDKLMTEFPEFRFSQSQASTYIAMEEYCPEVFEMIKRRVKEGKWDVTASMWVEGDKNIVSGESLCRHMLYTRQYLKRMGLEPEDVKIDWSPDTFGHAVTVPSIITRGGVSRYYNMRTGPGPWLFKWRSPDGSEVLAYNDKGTYNGAIEPRRIGDLFCNFTRETGLKDFMFMYGVGDHGGGPTRADLRKAGELAEWPIYPVIKLSRTDEFYSAVEKANPKLPVWEKDMNFIFEGCYTSQSTIKLANRVSEIVLPEAEVYSLVAGAVAGMAYPSETLVKSWRRTLFNHFHDILPGSGVRATYEYAEGLFQENLAAADSIRTRALRALGSKVNTALAAQAKVSTLGSGLGDGLGAGAGDPGISGGVTAYNLGAASAEPVLVFNQKAWPRTDVVYAKVWNKHLFDDRVVVRDSAGTEIKGQVVARGNYWGHSFITVAFAAKDVPATGYKVYAIDNSSTPVPGEGAHMVRSLNEGTECQIAEIHDAGVMENEFLRVEVDSKTGGVKHLIDKKTGFDYVPEGKLLGALEAWQETHHGMTAWVIGRTTDVATIAGGNMAIIQRGPNRVAVKVDMKFRNSTISSEIGLNAGSRKVDFGLRIRWFERGTQENGVTMLRAAFPVNVNGGTPTYEIPFGSQKRSQSMQEIPALKWADLSGESNGVTLVNDSKYGHSCNEDVLRLTLLRSSYDPDPLPEIRDHHIRYAVIAHEGPVDVVEATRAGEDFNLPMSVASASVQEGELPGEKGFVEVLTPNVFLSSVKKAEESDAVVVRMFEATGKETTAQIRISSLIKDGATAVETDVLERPLSKNTAKLDGDVLTVTVPAYGQATVKIG